jgi:NADPH-dependent curcumin reductase CurA
MRNRRVMVVKRCDAIPAADSFENVDDDLPLCEELGLVVEVLLVSVDPAMRGWLSSEVNYQTVPTGSVMNSYGIGRVIESDHPEWNIGDYLYGNVGWQKFSAMDVKDVWFRVDPDSIPLEKWMNALGLTGLTAWLGLNLLGSPRAGETIVVGTAAGAVGSVVGQLARARGMRPVGITGTPKKCELASREFGYEKMINYRASGDLSLAIADACPDGIDLFFDTVGGAIADIVFEQLKVAGRVIQCGTASVSTWVPPPIGPRRERLMLVKRLRWSGFVVTDHADRFVEAQAELAALIRDGSLITREHVLEGLEQAPSSIQMLYEGLNQGRLLIRP